MNDVIRCDACGQPINRLEYYIQVGAVILCDGCYMNMTTKEFLTRIGGSVNIKE